MIGALHVINVNVDYGMRPFITCDRNRSHTAQWTANKRVQPIKADTTVNEWLFLFAVLRTVCFCL